MEFPMCTLAHHKQSFVVQMVIRIQGHSYSANIALALSCKIKVFQQKVDLGTAMPRQ